jgi:hypothetical protein
MLPFSASDILKLLEQAPIWKHIAGLPKRLAELEARVKALEAVFAARPHGDATDCPRCGARLTFVSERAHHVFGDMGVKEHGFRCDGCGFETTREWSQAKGYS